MCREPPPQGPLIAQSRRGLRGACAQRLRDVGDLRPVLLVVVGIAAAHVTATQLTTECLRHSERLTTPLLLWASTCSNLLLGAPLLAWRARARGGAKPLLGAWDARPRQLALAVAPFFVLYLGANGLYIAALASLSPPLVVSIFSTTPALVALLSVPLLGRPLRALAVAAVACSTVGVVLVAQPLFGDVPPPALLFFLVTLGGELLVLVPLGGYGLVCGTALLSALQPSWPSDLASAGGGGALLLAGRAAADVAFNLLIALGLSLTHPLFISIGTLLSTPLALVLASLLHAPPPSPAAAVGIAGIAIGFCLLLADEPLAKSALIVSKADGMASVSLNHRPVNALTQGVCEELRQCLGELEADPQVRGLLLGSALPGLFSAGLDLHAFHKPDPDALADYWTAVQELWLALWTSDLATVAAISGHCPAGGCMVALACDARVMRLLVLGELLRPAEAAELGLVDEAQSEDLDEFIHNVSQPDTQAALGAYLASLRAAKERAKDGGPQKPKL
ncbi:dodecenoyl-CoA isomerase [Emiliania huxleyi CCMP1516]|uniref:EamA domain-containing protein n=2 Tax=Emiliania huxleyi TaxID=2903 RepID=A0A0D3KRB2_EMIH1|nr:dodecenoyl-CoA isomerase [Emiliania huxleyi CCMP1516]EOD38297.1 dodecenoyl-CoA isomerase [Emiliania huxleyi CCMP1516]|eukprot:XP_005790726.1 dodecenoyl-CoA isomerase [Emiliania huxleyi CCMP1516]